MIIQRALKFKLNPTEEQKIFMDKNLGASRFLYNQMLAERISIFNELKDDRDKLNKHEYKTEKTYKDEFEFLKEVDSTSLQQTRIDLDTAYRNFFRSLKNKGSKVGFPKFKSKKHHSNSYRSPMGLKVNLETHEIQMMKMPNKRIKYRHHSKPKKWFEGAELKSITISKTPSNKYYASLLFEGEHDYTGIPSPIDKVKGLDMSMESFYVDEQGNSPEFRRNYRELESKLALHQKRLAAKTKQSKNREKQRVKVARIHERIKNKRTNFSHQLSHKLIKENDCIVVESLSLKGMSQCLNLGKSVHDLGYSQFLNQLKYKALWNDKTIIFADKWFASSKTCSVCGLKNKDLLLQQREWSCVCGAYHKRDQNAAINLYKLGITAGAAGSACGKTTRDVVEQEYLCREA